MSIGTLLVCIEEVCHCEKLMLSSIVGRATACRLGQFINSASEARASNKGQRTLPPQHSMSSPEL